MRKFISLPTLIVYFISGNSYDVKDLRFKLEFAVTTSRASLKGTCYFTFSGKCCGKIIITTKKIMIIMIMINKICNYS